MKIVLFKLWKDWNIDQNINRHLSNTFEWKTTARYFQLIVDISQGSQSFIAQQGTSTHNLIKFSRNGEQHNQKVL